MNPRMLQLASEYRVPEWALISGGEWLEAHPQEFEEACEAFGDSGPQERAKRLSWCVHQDRGGDSLDQAISRELEKRATIVTPEMAEKISAVREWFTAEIDRSVPLDTVDALRVRAEALCGGDFPTFFSVLESLRYEPDSVVAHEINQRLTAQHEMAPAWKRLERCEAWCQENLHDPGATPPEECWGTVEFSGGRIGRWHIPQSEID